MNRYYIFGHEDDDLFKMKKQEWRGRFYQNLQGKGKGWSFPLEMKETIERETKQRDENHASSVVILPTQSPQSEVVDVPNLLVVSEEEKEDVDVIVTVDRTNVGDPISAPTVASTVCVSPTKEGEGKKKTKRCYQWDLPAEVYGYLKTFVARYKS